MNDTLCTYVGNREDVMVSYLYGEIGLVDRRAFDAHLASCALCRNDLDALGTVRSHLPEWEPPEAGPLVARQVQPEPRASWWQPAAWHVPVWAQTAAAAFFAAVSLGVAAGVANLEVRYDQAGVSMRTGWARAAAPVAAVSSHAPAQPSDAPWRAELAAFEQRLRSDLAKTPVAAAHAPDTPSQNTVTDEAIMQRVRSLLNESDRQNRRELALRVAEVVRSAEAQRQADLVKIDRSLGMIQNSSAAESMRQRQILNNLAVRVSQKP